MKCDLFKKDLHNCFCPKVMALLDLTLHFVPGCHPKWKLLAGDGFVLSWPLGNLNPNTKDTSNLSKHGKSSNKLAS